MNGVECYFCGAHWVDLPTVEVDGKKAFYCGCPDSRAVVSNSEDQT